MAGRGHAKQIFPGDGGGDGAAGAPDDSAGEHDNGDEKVKPRRTPRFSGVVKPSMDLGGARGRGGVTKLSFFGVSPACEH